MKQNNGGRYAAGILESPGAAEKTIRFNERNALVHLFHSRRIPLISREFNDRETFWTLMREVAEFTSEATPILHISAHGFREEGIGLTNNEVVRWTELREVLARFDRKLFLCLSSCQNGSRERFVPTRARPA